MASTVSFWPRRIEALSGNEVQSRKCDGGGQAQETVYKMRYGAWFIKAQALIEKICDFRLIVYRNKYSAGLNGLCKIGFFGFVRRVEPNSVKTEFAKKNTQTAGWNNPENGNKMK